MDLKEAIEMRHSVRDYEDREIPEEIKAKLAAEIERLNGESGLHIQAVYDEPKAFGESMLAHYGKFSGVRNYFVLAGKKGRDLQEKCGYFGEKLVLYAQVLGLNTCWVALTYKKVKGAYGLNEGEKTALVITFGYGRTQGKPHRSKQLSDVASPAEGAPQWFYDGVKAALLAPTAMNQQKFTFAYKEGKVLAKTGAGFYTKIDLGIARCHFEIAAGKQNFEWDK